MELHLTAMECHLPYGITQCYLPPNTSEHTPSYTPARQAGTRFTYPERMEGWVYLSDWLHMARSTNPAVYDREANSRAADHKSDALITTPPSHYEYEYLIHVVETDMSLAGKINQYSL